MTWKICWKTMWDEEIFSRHSSKTRKFSFHVPEKLLESKSEGKKIAQRYSFSLLIHVDGEMCKNI
jgi:hypothetical protein